MVLENIDKIYYIETRIKSLNGRKNLAIQGLNDESLEDLDAKIQALTNMLEML
jgi:hypothetical protein